MGCCKQLRPLCGKPLIRYVLETLLEAGLTHLIITVNAETQQPIEAIIDQLRQNTPYRTALYRGCRRSGYIPACPHLQSIPRISPFRCDIVLNPEPERGQGYSAALAVRAACARQPELLTANTACTGSPSGFLFCTADQPFCRQPASANSAPYSTAIPGTSSPPPLTANTVLRSSFRRHWPMSSAA